jgi:hypothetical protein
MSSGRTSSRFTIILIAFFVVVVVMDWVTSYLNLPLFSFLFPSTSRGGQTRGTVDASAHICFPSSFDMSAVNITSGELKPQEVEMIFRLAVDAQTTSFMAGTSHQSSTLTPFPFGISCFLRAFGVGATFQITDSYTKHIFRFDDLITLDKEVGRPLSHYYLRLTGPIRLR